MGTVGEFLALYNSQHYWCQRERSCKDIEKQAPGLMPYTNEHLKPLCYDLRQRIQAGDECKNAREKIQSQCFGDERGTGNAKFEQHEAEIANVLGVLNHCKSLWTRWNCDGKFSPSELKFPPFPHAPVAPQGPTISPYDPEYE